MPKTDKLLTRLLIGVIKNQAKRYLGEDVVAALIEAGSEYLGEELLDLLKIDASGRELAQKLSAAIESAASELERERPGMVLRLDEAPDDAIQAVVDVLTNLDNDLYGRRLQSAIQHLVAAAGPQDAHVRLWVSIQLYQAVLMAVVTIPELQFRAQDLLQQSRLWMLDERMRRIEQLASGRQPAALPASSVEALPEAEGASVPSGDKQRQLVSAKTNGLSAGLRIAAGSIELVKELGRGGIGSVWQGRIVATGDLVAIKFLDQDFNQHPGIVSSFERDVDALTALAGAAVPAMVRSATFEDSRHFYVYEYAENACSLATVLESRDAPLSKKLDVLCAVAQVLHGLHKQGWIHGDVKPANILLVGGIDGNVKFIDFGSAARIGERGSHDTITFTYAYAAPELLNLLRIHAEIRPTYDIYPLGVMLFQALDPGLARSTRMEEYWLISQLVTTPNLKAVVRKALAREPKDRFQTALEFLVALRGALTSAIEDSDS